MQGTDKEKEELTTDIPEGELNYEDSLEVGRTLMSRNEDLHYAIITIAIEIGRKVDQDKHEWAYIERFTQVVSDKDTIEHDLHELMLDGFIENSEDVVLRKGWYYYRDIAINNNRHCLRARVEKITYVSKQDFMILVQHIPPL